MSEIEQIRSLITERYALVSAAGDYVDNFERKMAWRDFYQVEVHNIIEVFGCIGHAFSTYEAQEEAPHNRFL
ncbi:MAG TPA: hypothetical protein VKO85_05985 [Wenzhouxiangellaceae bacterium]|nr:hypothetical protein [Wenzhouxiangellaceae bacterium]